MATTEGMMDERNCSILIGYEESSTVWTWLEEVIGDMPKAEKRKHFIISIQILVFYPILVGFLCFVFYRLHTKRIDFSNIQLSLILNDCVMNVIGIFFALFRIPNLRDSTFACAHAGYRLAANSARLSFIVTYVSNHVMVLLLLLDRIQSLRQPLAYRVHNRRSRSIWTNLISYGVGFVVSAGLSAPFQTSSFHRPEYERLAVAGDYQQLYRQLFLMPNARVSAQQPLININGTSAAGNGSGVCGVGVGDQHIWWRPNVTCVLSDSIGFPIRVVLIFACDIMIFLLTIDLIRLFKAKIQTQRQMTGLTSFAVGSGGGPSAGPHPSSSNYGRRMVTNISHQSSAGGVRHGLSQTSFTTSNTTTSTITTTRESQTDIGGSGWSSRPHSTLSRTNSIPVPMIDNKTPPEPTLSSNTIVDRANEKGRNSRIAPAADTNPNGQGGARNAGSCQRAAADAKEGRQGGAVAAAAKSRSIREQQDVELRAQERSVTVSVMIESVLLLTATTFILLCEAMESFGINGPMVSVVEVIAKAMNAAQIYSNLIILLLLVRKFRIEFLKILRLGPDQRYPLVPKSPKVRAVSAFFAIAIISFLLSIILAPFVV